MSGKELSGIRLIRRRGSCSHAARLAGGTFINCFGGVLQKPEVYFDSGEDGDRLAILQSWLESPLRDSLDRFLVQTEAQRTGSTLKSTLRTEIAPPIRYAPPPKPPPEPGPRTCFATRSHAPARAASDPSSGAVAVRRNAKPAERVAEVIGLR